MCAAAEQHIGSEESGVVEEEGKAGQINTPCGEGGGGAQAGTRAAQPGPARD